MSTRSCALHVTIFSTGGKLRLFQIHGVTCSYSSRTFLCALAEYIVVSVMVCNYTVNRSLTSFPHQLLHPRLSRRDLLFTAVDLGMLSAGGCWKA